MNKNEQAKANLKLRVFRCGRIGNILDIHITERKKLGK